MLHNNLNPESSPEELQRQFQEVLGTEQAVPLGVILHALDDEYFRTNLMLCRKRSDMLAMLFANPKNTEYEARFHAKASEAETQASSLIEEPGNMELIGRASKAMANWAKVGFAQVDMAIFEKRFSACLDCDQLRAPPNKMLYKLVQSKHTDPRICGACGCVAARKARLSSESCPLADPLQPRLNRWSEPLKHNKIAAKPEQAAIHQAP